jgi:hypothetical protein
MSPAIEKILAENNTLTPAEQRELLEFLSQNDTSSLRATAQLVNEIKGKYSFVATSSEDFQPEAGGNQSRRHAQRQETVIYIFDA